MSYDTGATSSQQYRLQRSTFLSPPLPSASAPPPLSQFLLLLPCQPPPSREVWPETNRLLDFVGKNGHEEWNLVKVTAFFLTSHFLFMIIWFRYVSVTEVNILPALFYLMKYLHHIKEHHIIILQFSSTFGVQRRWETRKPNLQLERPLLFFPRARQASRDALLLVSPNSSYLFAL